MKQLIFAAVIIVVLGAVLGAYYYITGSSEVRIPSNIQPTQELPGETGGMTGLQVAARIYDYIGTQRNADGFYLYSSNCEGDCPFVGSVFKNANTWPNYASIGMFRATGDPSYLDSARRDVDTMMAWCEQDKRECVRILYQVAELYKETGDRKYLNFVVDEIGVLTANEGGFADTNEAMLLAIDSIELAVAGKMTGDQKLIPKSVEKLSESERLVANNHIVYESDGNKFRTFSCWPELARIELYKATEDKSYLEKVKTFADSVKLDNNVQHLWFMTDIQPCIDVYQQLGELTGDRSYSQAADKMIEWVLQNFWDSKNAPKVSGNDSIKSTVDQKFSSITDSAYMVYLLSKSKDSVFKVI
jgi:hypothetical protein